MKTVYKYDLGHLTPGQPEPVHLPLGAKVLHFNVQDGRPVMWCLVDVDEKTLDLGRKFLLAGTGQRLPEFTGARDYLGTILTAGGALVWHLFEMGVS